MNIQITKRARRDGKKTFYLLGWAVKKDNDLLQVFTGYFGGIDHDMATKY